MFFRFLALLLLLSPAPAAAQKETGLDKWDAHWITHPDVGPQAHAAVLFRTTFELGEIPDSFPVYLSADNHFRLYVNGSPVAFGPQLGEITHWRYDSHDLRKWLKAGMNTLAVEVFNWGHFRMFGIQSVHTGLIIQGRGAARVVTTNGHQPNYETHLNKGLSGHEVKWRTANNDIVGGLYANNPTDSIIGDRYPWNWELRKDRGFTWKPAKYLENASLVKNGSGFLWLLEPRNTPHQQHSSEPFQAVRLTENCSIEQDWLTNNQPTVFPKNGQYRVLLDNGVVTVGHPLLHWNQGRGAEIKFTWAENLFNPDGAKPHRDSVDNKLVKGYFDVILPDGQHVQNFSPSWYRAFRYLEMTITTGNEDLEMWAPEPHAVTSIIPILAEFTSNDEQLNQAFEISRRTVENCTQDYFLSDAYYETMQYIGDTKVHALAWQALTGDYRHTRNALMDFHRSRNEDGVLKSCYPLRYNFYHSSYSLIWVDMVKDYFFATRDTALVLEVLPGIRQTLDYFGRHFDEGTGYLGKIPFHPFVDWYVDNTHGWAPGSDHAASVPITLQYAHALQSAESLLDELNLEGNQAAKYQQRRRFINETMVRTAYSPARHLLAERPSGDYFDQHSSTLGVLTGALPRDAMSKTMEAVVREKDLSPATFYFRYYLLEALQRSGREDLTLEILRPWFDIIDQGATTVVERFEGNKPTRSEAHPWGASPVIFAYRIFAGIDLETFTGKIRMEPKLGSLVHIEGYCPAFGPDRGVSFQLAKVGGRLTGSIRTQSLPVTLLVNGETYAVAPHREFTIPK